MSGCFESVRLNACVHRLDLSLYWHPKELWGNGVRNPREKSPVPEEFSPDENRSHNAASSRTASPTHYQWAIPAPRSKVQDTLLCLSKIPHCVPIIKYICIHFYLFSCLGQNSSVGCVLGWVPCVMQHGGFDPPQILLVEGIFSLELTWVLNPFPKTLGWEYRCKQSSSPCTHALHGTDSRDPDIRVSGTVDRWRRRRRRCPEWVMLATETPGMHHSQRQNVTISITE